jgi:hypothetical protein
MHARMSTDFPGTLRTEVCIVHVRIEAHRTERHKHHWQVVDSIVRYLR